jgi:cytochrome P450
MTDVSSYDPLTPETVEDPFPAYAWLRAECPVHRTDQFGHPLYTLSRRRDVHAVLTDPWHWSNRLGPGVGYAGDERRGDIQRFDPPEHTTRRKFARDEFNPLAIKMLEPQIRALATEMADTMAAGPQPFDLHDGFALPIPILSFIDMMGADRADRDLIKRWADEMVQGLSDPYAAGPATDALRAYLLRRIRAVRAGEPSPDGLLVTYATRRLGGDEMPELELANMLSQLMVAGHETTTSLITNMVFRLLERRERWDAVCADPSLAEAAVEESLRFDPPVLGLCRTNTEPVDLGEEHLDVGTKIMVLYASANRDPAAFDDPDSFRLDRPWSELRRHYSFGWGMHHCLGAPIARQTARVALETLIERFPTLRLAGPTERIAPEFLWGRRRLPVSW